MSSRSLPDGDTTVNGVGESTIPLPLQQLYMSIGETYCFIKKVTRHCVYCLFGAPVVWKQHKTFLTRLVDSKFPKNSKKVKKYTKN